MASYFKRQQIYGIYLLCKVVFIYIYMYWILKNVSKSDKIIFSYLDSIRKKNSHSNPNLSQHLDYLQTHRCAILNLKRYIHYNLWGGGTFVLLEE